MKANISSKKRISALALGALAAVSIGSSACSSTNEPTGSQEQTASASSSQVAALTCTPLLTTTAPLLNCGAIDPTQVTTASSIQTQMTAQIQAAFASLTLTPNFTANTVGIASPATAFTTFFPTTLTAPLLSDGFFTTTTPLAVGTIAPNFALQASMFGLFPTLATTPIVTPTLTPFLNTTANTTFAAFNTATLNAATAANASAVNTSAIQATTLPLTIFISTPIATTVPFTCAGTIPLGCQ
jgi:hypothetical protein